MSHNRSGFPDDGDTQYRSYLLRLWQEGSSGEHRALLQDVLSSESRYFSSLEDLFTYLDTSQTRPEGNKNGHRETK